MSWDKCASEEIYETDASSLCTLCVLEARANAFENLSSSLSPDSQTFSSFKVTQKLPASALPQSRLNVVENNVTARINYLIPSHRESFNKVDEIVKLDNEVIHSVESQRERAEYFQWKATNRHGDDNNGSKYPDKTIQPKKTLRQLSPRNEDEDRLQQTRHEQSTIFSSFSEMSRSISFEIGIMPELSQTIIDRVLTLVDKNLIESTKKIGILSKFDESSNEQPQVSILKTVSETMSKATKREKVVSTVNRLLEPIPRSERMGPSGVPTKRDKSNGTIDTGMEVAKKKPKIVTEEVWKLPVFRLPLGQDRAEQTLKENMINDHWGDETKAFQRVTKGRQISMETGESERRLVRTNNAGSDKPEGTELESQTHCLREGPRENMGKVEKERNDAEGQSDRANGTATGNYFRNPSERDSPFLTKRFPPNYSDLSMLQRKITENSQSLMKQAEEMKRLSSFIEELKETLTSEETQVDAASRRERPRVKKEFVSKSTQTADSHQSTIWPEDPTSGLPVFLNVQGSNVESSETNNNPRPIEQTDTATFHRNWFPPVELKPPQESTERSGTSAQETGPKPPAQKDCPEKMTVEKSIDDKLLSVMENHQISNSAVQYDPYYNPLRPRRWPKNRNNTTKFGLKKQSLRKNSFFPPLPILIENRRSTNANK